MIFQTTVRCGNLSPTSIYTKIEWNWLWYTCLVTAGISVLGKQNCEDGESLLLGTISRRGNWDLGIESRGRADGRGRLEDSAANPWGDKGWERAVNAEQYSGDICEEEVRRDCLWERIWQACGREGVGSCFWVMQSRRHWAFEWKLGKGRNEVELTITTLKSEETHRSFKQEC